MAIDHRCRTRFVETAGRRLQPMVLAALRVRVALEVARGSPHDADILEDAATPLLGAATDLQDWLDDTAVPEGLEVAAAELHAVAGVYRNAAIVYPGAPDLDAASRAARGMACDGMLDQGEHHVAMFWALSQPDTP